MSVRKIRAFRDEQRVLILSLRCNNHCRFCFYTLHDRASRDDPDMQTVAQQLAKWSEEGVTTVNLHGGEPTIAPTFLKTVSLIDQLGMDWVLNSNVRAFSNEAFARRVLRTPPRQVLTTVLGADAETHEYLSRGPGSFAQTMGGIARLRKAGIDTNAHVVIVEQNYRQLPEIVERLVDLGCSLKFSFVVFSGEALIHFDELAHRLSDALPYLRSSVELLEQAKRAWFMDKAQVCLWPEKFAPIQEYVTDHADHRYYECCEGCVYRDRCSGISSTYAERFGTHEFSAIHEEIDPHGVDPKNE